MNNSKTSLRSVGEFGLIRRLTALSQPVAHPTIIGPGDDCAVLPARQIGLSNPDNYLLISTDSLIEGQHFDLRFSSFFDLGWKSIAVNLSDIAAMGGNPQGIVIALCLRSDIAAEEAEEIYRGINALANKHHTLILGGDTVAGSQLALTITILGSTSLPPLLRSGVKAGDDIWVSGSIGGAGAGFSILQGQISPAVFPDKGEIALKRHRRPEPRVQLGKILLESGEIHAMIDISDGLLQDAGHLAEKSKVQLSIRLAEVPLEYGIAQAGVEVLSALSSGDDYELLFSAPAAARSWLSALSSSEPALPVLSRIGFASPLPSNQADNELVILVDKDDKRIQSARADKKGKSGIYPGYDHFR